jgi:hypothetical protein
METLPVLEFWAVLNSFEFMCTTYIDNKLMIDTNCMDAQQNLGQKWNKHQAT